MILISKRENAEMRAKIVLVLLVHLCILVREFKCYTFRGDIGILSFEDESITFEAAERRCQIQKDAQLVEIITNREWKEVNCISI